ncbi:division abnormally delayed protein [Anopheles funestus]|uniref:division abnormally delayed protein n=1 Tax=Anopheles funestus TaxID=62324 RepID=UPI0020C6F914|nr:division abnormally delayed protein [Anopheles funestus]XP_049291065.1 division abnormally delayed protein [Anopheles funestus]XP_049291066.1 division abnormally delayed protein [Anopheles funestus]XP_049291067.1 division abnormally delayed protein [Anopheles funestus]XP_049291068.1 division abnormally delayed protein [Anopheles funestus]XP_049291069.1 division abnormally delayed protein [Anopheles funestus]
MFRSRGLRSNSHDTPMSMAMILRLTVVCLALVVTLANGSSVPSTWSRVHRTARDTTGGGREQPSHAGTLMSCERINNFFSSINVTVNTANQGSERDQGPVCGGICCDAETERQLEAKATKNFERLVKHHIRSQRGQWETAANLYKDYLLQLLRQSENKTLILFSTVYSKMSPLSREPIRELYETIRLNLIADRPGDDLELVTGKFFRNLFPVAYHHAIHSDVLHGTERGRSASAGVSNRDFHSDYKNCLVHTYDELKPFGMVPQQLSSSLVSSVSAASVLLRALREGSEVLLKLEEIGVSAPSCRNALLRMNYCGSCKRYNHLHAKPCSGLCQNVMRGCLIEFVGALNKGWSTLTEAIVPLIATVRSQDGIESEIKSLDGKLSNAIMHAMEIGPQLEKQVEQACGVPSMMPSEYLAEGAYDDTPQTLAGSSKWTLAPINELLQFEMTIDKNKDLFIQLSTTLCEDEDYHPTDEDCWTGSSLSDYTQQVVTTIGNRYNPEVMYNATATVSPHMQTLVDRLINLKTAVNKAYSSNNYRGDVDKMQSDMAEGSGDSYPSDDDEDGDLASGSGDDVSPRTIFRDSGHVTPNFNEISSSKRISASSCWSLLSVSTFVLSLPLLLLNDRFSRH